MSYRSIRDAVWAARLPTAELVVALRLVEHWPRIMPSIGGLAEFTGLSERAVQYALRALEERGLIRATQNPGRRTTFEFMSADGAPITVPQLRGAGGAPGGAGGAPPTPAPGAPEADKILKQAREADPPRGFPAVLRELPEGFVPSEELLSAAELAGCPRAVFLERLADLGTGPIGGTRGVSVGKLDAYLLVQAGKWKAWAAKAETPQRGSPAPRHGVITGKDDRGFPWTLEASEAHARYAEKHGLDLNEVLTEVQRRRVVETLGLGRAKEVIGELLTKRARAKGKAERERNTATGGRPDARDDRALPRPRAAPQAG